VATYAIGGRRPRGPADTAGVVGAPLSKES